MSEKMSDKEVIFSISYGVFGDSNFTYQRLRLVDICLNTISHDELVTLDTIENISIVYCFWQNISFPNIKFIETDGIAKISDFSHDDDFTWNDVQKHIRKYLVQNVIEFGCKTEQETLRNKLLNNNNLEKNFPDYPHPDISVYE